MIHFSGSLLAESLRAHISVTPKIAKDPSACIDQISLLNVDMKLFAKVLYFCLLPYNKDLIRPDKEWFIPGQEPMGQHSKSTECRLLGQVGVLSIIFTDAEKAFDMVNWSFIRGVLEHMELGETILSV